MLDCVWKKNVPFFVLCSVCRMTKKLLGKNHLKEYAAEGECHTIELQTSKSADVQHTKNVTQEAVSM